MLPSVNIYFVLLVIVGNFTHLSAHSIEKTGPELISYFPYDKSAISFQVIRSVSQECQTISQCPDCTWINPSSKCSDTCCQRHTPEHAIWRRTFGNLLTFDIDNQFNSMRKPFCTALLIDRVSLCVCSFFVLFLASVVIYNNFNFISISFQFNSVACISKWARTNCEASIAICLAAIRQLSPIRRLERIVSFSCSTCWQRRRHRLRRWRFYFFLQFFFYFLAPAKRQPKLKLFKTAHVFKYTL